LILTTVLSTPAAGVDVTTTLPYTQHGRGLSLVYRQSDHSRHLYVLPYSGVLCPDSPRRQITWSFYAIDALNAPAFRCLLPPFVQSSGYMLMFCIADSLGFVAFEGFTEATPPRML
jgi:hypothetical protein